MPKVRIPEQYDIDGENLPEWIYSTLGRRFPITQIGRVISLETSLSAAERTTLKTAFLAHFSTVNSITE